MRRTVESISRSDFLLGRKGSSWTLTLGWLLQPENFAKVHSGKYTDRKRTYSKLVQDAVMNGEHFPLILPETKEGNPPMTADEMEDALDELFHPHSPALDEAARLLGITA